MGFLIRAYIDFLIMSSLETIRLDRLYILSIMELRGNQLDIATSYDGQLPEYVHKSS